MAVDWYPLRLSELSEWHETFAAQCVATGTTHGLSAGNVSQAGQDRTLVGLLTDFDDAIRGYVQAWTEFRDSCLAGDPNAPFPTPPSQPALSLPPGTFLPGIEARTRLFANVIKADADYTPAVGEDYGIVSPAGAGPGTPSLKASAVAGTSQVTLRINKAGHTLIAIDMRRGGGDWGQVGVSQTATFTDTSAPLTAGQPEQREYRAQGMAGNQRIGELSATVSVVTTP